MSYTVLARKYRSRNFDELIGQEAISTTLKNAIAGGRVHHGYLFTGTRGVGKTSMARIVAKALNCQAHDAPTVDPCGECESCRSVAEGSDIDVIEIDAASNTGVDNIRELRSNANYRPARSRYKIYIIDEVHMLSTGAFNALLKTLEEPPDHVKFIFATTEPQKVPATIQSRCQRFDFKSVSVDEIAEHLSQILQAEGVEAEAGVMRRIARLANGSVRDGISLLDQVLSLGDKTLTTGLVDEVLPAPHDELLAKLFDHLVAGETAEALRCVDQSLSSGYTPGRFCDALINQVRTLMLLSVCGADTDLVDVPAQFHEQLVEQSGKLDAATYVYVISMLENLRRNVRGSGSPRALVDACMVRLSMLSNFTNIETLLAELQGSPPAGKKKVVSGEPPGREPAAPRSQASAVKRPAPAPRPAVLPPARKEPVVGQEKRDLLANPTVRQTMELFDGTLTDIRKKPNDAESKTPDTQTS